MIVVAVIVYLILGALSFFVLYRYFFVAVNIFIRSRKLEEAEPNTRFVIVIPAYNEEALLGKLLDSLKELDYPGDLYDIAVIADNCSDMTADVAKAKGVRCYVRTDPTRRGKPYALEFGFQQTGAENYDGFVVIDADSTMSENFLKVMNAKLLGSAKIVQGYDGIFNPDETWLTRLSHISLVIRHRLLYEGRAKLGLSCPLLGNGMCLSSEIIRKYGWNAFSITENWEYHAKLLLEGYAVDLALDAAVYAQGAKSLSQARSQRVRWVKGRLETAKNYVPKLVWNGIRKRSAKMIDGAIDLLTPEVSLLFDLSVICGLLFMVFLHPAPVWFDTWVALLLLSQIAYFGIAMIIARSGLKAYLALLVAPVFLIWKILIAVSSFIGIRGRQWVRTQRH